MTKFNSTEENDSYEKLLKAIKDSDCYTELEKEIEELKKDRNYELKLPIFKEKILQYEKFLNFKMKSDTCLRFFRARSYKTTQKPTIFYSNSSEIGNPPSNLVKEPGRFNDIRESYLYLTIAYQNDDTFIDRAKRGAIIEIVKANREWLCLAEFEVSQDTNLFRLAPFNNNYKYIEKVDKNFSNFLEFLELEISKPIYSSDDYIFSVKFAKILKKLNFDGVIYISSVVENINNFYNVCSFKPSRFKLKGNLYTGQYINTNIFNFEY